MLNLKFTTLAETQIPFSSDPYELWVPLFAMVIKIHAESFDLVLLTLEPNTCDLWSTQGCEQ